jgi:hypothetical protein
MAYLVCGAGWEDVPAKPFRPGNGMFPGPSGGACTWCDVKGYRLDPVIAVLFCWLPH